MKKCLILFISIILISFYANAQYKYNKTKYDHRSYSYQQDDPYYPAVAGVASALLPGFGQMVGKEVKRGAAFLGGAMVLGGFTKSMMNGDIVLSDAGEYLIGGPVILGLFGIYFWSIGDAVRIAKVNNLAFRDLKKTSFNFQIQPCLYSLNIPENVTSTVGLTLKVSF